MTFPEDLLAVFAAVEGAIKRLPWYGQDDWSCCSGLWQPKRYGDTVLLRLTKGNWSSRMPVPLEEGGEIQYAAWVDERLHARSKVRFEMHVFAFPNQGKGRKGDFTIPFRRENQAAIDAFGFHDTRRGSSVPYAGAYGYKDAGDLEQFLVKDFSDFASLSGSVDKQLNLLA